MSAERFVGTWRLVYCEHVYPDGEIVYPLGDTPRGRTTYAPDGRMEVLLDAAIIRLIYEAIHQFSMGVQRPVLSPPEMSSVDVLFSGRYEVTETHVTYHIETSSLPDWSGLTSRRSYAFSKQRLALSLDAAPMPGVLSLIWECDGEGKRKSSD